MEYDKPPQEAQNLHCVSSLSFKEPAMSSLVIYSNEFEGHRRNGMNPAFFKYRFLAEGDSWMDRSAMFHTSLLQQLAPAFDATFEDVLVINLAQFGDTIRRMGDCLNNDFRQWVNTPMGWKFDAILLSAGGNDFIDAARDPGPGQGILKDLANAPLPASGHDCVRPDAVAALVTQYMDPSFTAIHDMVQNSHHADTPIFLNNYDTPVARNAPAFPGGRSWLFDAYTRNSIPPALWPDLTDSIFNDVQTTIAGWTVGRPSVFTVPTDGTLTPADPLSNGDSGDWLNEIHPNHAGWQKLAAVWKTAIKNVLV
jgi:hypothetical protein